MRWSDIINLGLRPGDTVRVTIEGVLDSQGYLKLEDGSTWNLVPVASTIEEVTK